ncbi:MAG TPA: PAS domain-containing protein, partial [Chitinophagaceae bacterium]|nr:PAS domain-containing protein [Chitinophagaceae bacterium]
IKEIDRYALHHQTAASKAYIDLFKKKVSDHSHFIEKITNTSPSAVYVFDITNLKRIYSNDKAASVFGYTQNEVNELSLDTEYKLIHPDDVEVLQKHLEEIKGAAHKEVKSYKCRIKDKTGQYKWLRHYETVFRRSPEGKVLEVIGIAIDVDKEKRTAEQLKLQEQQLLEAQEIAHIGSFTWYFNNRPSSVTPELSKILEIDTDQPEEFFKRVHPEDKERVEKAIEEAKKTGSFECEYRYHGNSQMKIIWAKGKIIYQDGEAVFMMGTIMDITERHNLLQELQENQNFIQKIADATPSIIALYNVNTGQYVFINQGLEKLLGYSNDKALEQGVQFFAEIVHPDDLDTLMEKNTKALEAANDFDNEQKNDIIEFVYRMLHQNGSYRWFHTYGTIFDRNNAGRVEHVLNISLDITEQIESTQKIKEQEHFIQHIAEASPTILYLFDVPENNFAYINREVYYVLGYTTEEIIEAGENVTAMLYHPDDYLLLPERKESNKKFQHQNSMVQYECRMKTKEGEWKWLLIREVIFKWDEEDRPTQILGAALDITRRKEMERSIIQNAYQLEQSNTSLEEFAYVASHDLKEPLRKISTFGDKLVATQIETLTDDGKFFLKKIVDAAQRMQTMITDLLSVSMISGNKSFQLYSLQTVLEEVKQALEYKIEQQNAIIEGKDLPEAIIIPSQFRQVFQNILSNSLKFVRENVQPVINISHTYLQPEEVENFQLQKANRYLKISFEDNGIGFEEEYSGKIFQIFQRLHGRNEYEGTGIGLAICKKIVEHHGGIIYATGKPNQGAVMTLILPGEPGN